MIRTIVSIIIVFVAILISSTASSEQTIIIDPLYGGKDYGPKYQTFFSKQITLRIAKEVGELLLKSGQKVIYTRNDDTLVEPERKIEIASINKGAVFVSIGINSAKMAVARGFEIYTPPRIEAEPHVIIDSKPHSLQSRPELRQFLKDLASNKRDSGSRKLAESLQRSINKVVGLHDRGIKNGLFKTLLETDMPSVVVMIGFMTNRDDREFMTNLANQEKMAKGIFEGIKCFLDDFDQGN
jgi:N-acetylmuramoyl-L-alanine amidase